MKANCLRFRWIVSAFLILAAVNADAANGVWNGTQNAYWTNSANWSASPYPAGVSDTASFTNAGNGQTTIDLTGGLYIRNIRFETPNVAAYTIGAGAAGNQTLVLNDGGEVTLAATAGNSQTFNCGVQLGGDRTAQSYTFRNDNPAQSLTFADLFGCPIEASGNAGNKTLIVTGSGPITFNSLRPAGASGLILTTYNNSTITLAGSNTLYQANFNGGSGNVLDIGDKELYLSAAGGNCLNVNQDTVITGTGKLRLSTSDTALNGGYNYADLNVVAGRTLTVYPSITGLGGIEIWTGTGTFVFKGTNTFLGHICFGTAGGTLVASSIGNRGSLTSNLGAGTNIYFSNTGRLVYTGTGESSDRLIVLNADGRIEQSGPSGKLTFTATPILLTQGRTLTLQGSTAGIGEFSAPLANTGANALTLTKNGSGTWILSGTNSYTGATTVNGGKLLVNSPGGLLGAGSAVTVNYGAVLGGNGTLNGSVTLASGGTLAPGDVNSAGTLSLNSTLTMTGATLLYDLVTPDGESSVTDKVTVASTVTLNGVNTLSLNFPNGYAPAGSYTLMTFPYRTGTGSFVLSPAYPNVSLYTNATTVRLDVGPGGAKSLLWKGDVSANWDGTDQNWRTNGAALAFTPGDPVAFDDTASLFTVNSSAAVTPSSTLFNNSLNNYTVSASIDGTGTVYKLGSGEVTLTGNSPFTNTVTIASGLLRVGEGGILGGGNFRTNIINNGELVYATTVAQTNSGLITGSGNLTVCGGSSLTLSGTNTYSGLTLVTNGTLRIGSASALGSTGTGTLVAPSGILELGAMPTGIVYASEALELRGKLACSNPGTNTVGGAIYLYNNAVLDVGAGSSLFVTTTTPDTGSNTVTKTGNGTLRFVGDPNHRSVFVIAEGTVELANGGSTDAPWLISPGATLRDITAGALGDYFVQANGTLDLRVNETVGGLSGSGLVTNSGTSAITLTVGGNSQSGDFSGVIRNGAGAATVALSKANSGIQTLSGANTHSGGTTVSGGTLNINNSSALGTGTFTISGGGIDNTSGAAITLANNNPLALNGDFTFVGSKSLNLGTGTAPMNGNRAINVLTNTLSIGGVISGGYTLTKNGAGILALSGANTYSGATTVNGGALIVNSPGSLASGSAVAVNTGAIFGGNGTVNGTVTAQTNSLLAPGGLNAVGTLTLANASATALTLNGALIAVDLATVADVGACDQIALTGAGSKVVLNGVTRIALNFPTNGIPAGTYTLISSQAGITTNAGASVALLTSYPNVTLTNGVNSIVLIVEGDGIPGALWTGAVSGTWDGSDQNWLTNGVADIYPAGAATVFDDTASGNFAVSSSGAVSPFSLLFNNSANDYSVDAQLTGTGPLTKQGSAAVTLAGMTAYNPGAIALNDGTLTLGGASQLNGGSFAGDILNNGSLTYASSADQTYSGQLSGYGALIKAGNGALTLSGSNLYSGVTFVNAGTLRISHAYGLGTTTAGTTVNPAGTLELANNVYTLAETLTLGGTLSSQSGSNTFNGSVTLTAGAKIDVASGSTLVLKAFRADGPFVKTGAGRLNLSTDPNGNGLMTVKEGSVEVANTMDANAVINSGATLYAVGGAFNDTSSRVQVDAGGSYVVRGDDTIGGLGGAGLVYKDTTGTATLTIGNNNLPDIFSGTISNGNGTVALTKTGSGVQILSGKSTYTGATTVSYSGALYVVSPGSLANTAVTVNNTGTILGGDGSIQGSVTLAGYNVLSPGVSNTIGTLTLGSTLSLTASTLLADIPAAPGDACDRVAVTGALTLAGVNTVSLSFPAGAAAAGDYTLMSFASKTGSGTFQLAGAYPNASLVLSSTNLLLRVTGSGTSSLAWNGNVSSSWDGSDANWLNGSTPATFTDGSAVTFTDTASSFNVTSLGDVTPSALVFNNAANVYSVAADIKGSAPLNKFGLASTYLTGISSYNPNSVLIANGWVYLTQNAQLNGGTYGSNLVVNAGGFGYGSTMPQVLSGVISGSGGLNKYGSGTLTLANTNTISGSVTLSAGTLYARGCAQAMGTAPLTLSGGALELDHDTGLSFVNNATFSASTTIKSGRLTYGPGVTNTLGTLTIGNQTFYTAPGLNLISGTPYGLKFGNTTISGSTPTFDVANNGIGIGHLTLGALSGNNHLNKTGAGTLYLGTASLRSGGTNTVSAGTLKLGNPTALGTNGVTLAITLNGGTLDLASDSTTTNYPTAVGGATTILSDKATPNSAGITHILGALTINNTLGVAAGANVSAGTPFGLTFGTTTLTGNPTFDVAANGTLTLGSVSGNYSVTKGGYGTLFLASPNAYTGMTTVTRGLLVITGANGSISNTSAITLSGNSTLELRNSPTTNWTDRVRNGIPITLAGATLNFAHPGGSAHYSESLGALSLTGSTNQFMTSQANVGYTSVVTVASLARSGGAVLNFVGEGLGDSDRNRIIIPGLPEGNLGPWATVNGTNFAYYSATRGVCASTNLADIAARGPSSVIPNDSNLVARISSPGVAGPITLADAVTTRIFGIRQSTGTDAVIATLNGTANKYVLTHGLFITDGQASLTVGEKINDGILTALVPAEGLLFDVDGANGVLTVNAQILDVGGNVPVKKYGNGRVVFAGQNIYSNTTTIYEGTLVAQHANALGSSAVGGTVVNTNATLEIAGGITTAAEALTLYGTLSSQSGVNTFAGAITTVYGGMIDVSSSSLLIVSGSTTGSGGFTKTGSGIMRITADPNQTGLYTVNEGTLELAHPGTTDAPITIAPGATLREITSGVLHDSMTVTNNGTFDMRGSDTMGMLAGSGLVTVGTGVSATLAIGNESSKVATFSGVIENGKGILNLQKSGSGTQILSGTNTYTGTTVLNERSGLLLVNAPGSLQGTASVTVNSGATLGGNGSVMSPVTVVAGGSLLPADAGLIGTLTLGSSLTLTDATLFYDMPATLSAADAINVAGALTVNGVNTIALSFPGGVAPAGDYTLMTFASKTGTGSFVVLGIGSTPNATLELTATSLILHVSDGTGFGPTWNGNLSSVWDGGILNWKVGTSPASYADGSIVTFDDSALANYTVSSVGPGVSPSAIFINNTTNNYTINAALAGSAPIVKSGWGAAYLNNALSYNPASITVNPVGALYIGTAGNAQLNNGVYDNPIFLNGGRFQFESGATLTLNSLITGGGSVSKYGTGTITLNAANTYRGGTTHGAGQMNLNNGGSGGTSSSIGIGRIYIGNGAIFDNTSGSDVTLSTSNPQDWNGNFIYAGSSNSLNFGTGSVNINSASRTITVWANTFTIGGNIGQNGGTYGLTKAGNGTLVLSGSSSYAGGTTLSGGTLCAQKNAAALGTGSLTLNTAGTTLEYDNDSTLTFNNAATVSASMTVKSGRLTSGPGVAHNLGTLSINASTLSVAPGTNVLANTPYGLAYGATTLSAGPAVFNVANNGSANGTLTLGAVSGNFPLIKKGNGVLKLASVSLLGGPITNNNGRVLAVTGGSCSNSSVTVQAAELADAAASLSVLYAAANTQWTCSNLVVATSVAPAASRPALDFSFAALPSTTVAPLRVRDAATFATNPVVNVYMGNLSVPTNAYPLMVVGGTAPTVVPTLNMVGGYTNSYLYWNGKTLMLRLYASGVPVKWAPGVTSSGTWDVNNSANLVWTNIAAKAYTYYQEPFGAGVSGDNVLFDDSTLTAPSTVTLAGSPSPSSVVMTNTLYAYTFTGSGAIAGAGTFSKFGTNRLTLATANTYTGATTFASGIVDIPAGAGLNVGNTANAGQLNVGALSGNTAMTISGGTVNASKSSIPAIQVGTTSGAIGVINLSAGLLTSGSEIFLGAGGNGQNGFGALNVTGGSVTSASYLALGRATAATGSNRGELLVSGGTVTVNANNIEIGSYQNGAGNTCVATLTGGTTTLASGAGDLIVGNSQNGIMNVSGSAVVNVLNTGKALKVGNASGVTGIANLNGGLVTVPAVTQAAGAYGYLNFDGGTLKATKNNAAFMSGLTSARIYAGGATIDDGGYAITIAQSLRSPSTGNGVSLAGMTFSGKGFVAPPIVDIAGFGNGASAIATIDDGGNLTGVTLTSPGANYHMGSPTLTFTGGGGTVTQSGSASTAPNTSGGLTKFGNGALTLTGTNTYSGPTVVNGGRLVLVTGASCSNSAVTVQSVGTGTNAIFGVRYGGADTQAAIAGLTTAAGLSGGNEPDLEFAFSAVPSSTTAPLAVTGGAVFAATPHVRVILTGLTVPNASYPLMTVGGTAPTAVPTLTLAGGYSGSTLSWSGNTLMLNLAGSAAAIKWGTGAAGNGAWNVGDSANLIWKDGADSPTFYQETPGSYGDQVVFDDTFISLNNTVALNTTVTPSGVTANNALYAYTLSGSGAIAGTNALVKSGAANFRLATANTYSGGTLINAGGVLQVSSSGGLGTGGVTNNGTLNLDAGAGGTGDINYTGLNNSLSGAGTNNLSLGTGAARMYLTGNYSGFVGVWNIGVGAYAGASRAEMTGLDNAAATINVLTNGTLWVSAAGTHYATANLYGGDTGESYGQLRVDTGLWAGPVVLCAPITGVNDGYFGSESVNSEIAGTISEVNGPYEVSKVGSKTLTFSGANTYLGPTAVKAGALRVPTLGSISGGPSPLGAPTTPAQGTVKLGYGGTTTTLIYSGMGETSDRIIDLAGTTGGATIEHAGTNLLKLTGGMTYTGSGSKTLTLQGSTVGTGEVAFAIANGATAGTSNTLVKAGTGTWVLSAANTHTGGTQIKGGGTLVAAHPNALGTTFLFFPNEVATVDLAHDGEGEYANEYIANLSAVVTIKSNRSTPGDGINHNIGVMRLSGVTVFVTNGENVVSGNATITTDFVDLYAGSTQTAVLAPMTADLLVKGGVSIWSSAYDKTLQLDGTSQGSAVLGPITNGLGKVLTLTKANTSTWTLYGSNTFSGATTISKGAIVLAGTNGALAGTSGITLSGNAVLELRNSELTNSTDRLRDAAGITLSGGTLRFAHSGGAADYSERLGVLTATASSNTFATSLADAGRTSVVTIAKLSYTGSATLNFTGEGLGESDRNRIFVTTDLSDGPIGSWATINGTNLAAYSSTRGVYVFGSSGSDTVTNLAARGNVPNSVVPDNASAVAQITEPGESGPITLEGSWTNRLFLLTQNNPTGAIVDTVSFTTNKSLLTSALAIAPDQGDLTIGVAPGNGYVAPLTAGGNLMLRNDSTTSLLTLNAAVANNTSASTISKFGAGTAVLAGSNTFSGAVTVSEGTLEFGGPFGQRLSNVIGGAGAVAKSGNSLLHVLSANTYTGPTTIKEGVVRANENTTFGTTNSPVTITDGGTLNVGCTPDVGGTRTSSSISFGNKLFIVSGAGYQGQGAINNSSTAMQYNAFSRISLAGDTTFGANQRWDMNNNVAAALDLNDYTLSKTGSNEIAVHNVQINPGAAGKMVLNQGLFRFETGSSVNGTTNNTVTVNRGATLDLWQLNSGSPSLWSVILNEGAFFNGSGGQNVTNQNVWNGPVTLNGRAFISSGYAPSHLTLNGDISGAGSLVKQGGATVTLWLYGTNNTYGGETIVSNGTLFARHAASLPGYDAGRVTVAPAATLALVSGDGTVGWSAVQIQSLHDTSAFINNTSLLSIDTTPASVDYVGNLTKTLALTKRGNNTLTLSGTNTFTGAVAVNGGTLTFAPSSTNFTGAITVSGGSTNTTLNIGGVTTFVSANITNALTVGAANGDRSIATLSTNATFGKLLIGNGGGASGAFIQNNGNLAVSPTLGSTDLTDVSNGGNGYYRMNKGSLTTGQLGINGGGGGNGVFDLFDGTVNVPTSNGWLIFNWGTGISILNMFGGSVTAPPGANDTTLSYSGNAANLGVINMLGADAFLNTAQPNRSLNMARSAGSFLAAVNLNSGTIVANKVYAGVTGTPSVFGFNGGTLRAATSSLTFMQGLTAALVYPGGAVIDSSNVAVTVAQSLLAPNGYGVTYIPVLSGGTNYIGAPAVKISGGSGLGATAIATVDLDPESPTKGQVTGITVTSAGTGYQWYDVPVVTLSGGGATIPATVGPCYMTPNANSGGLTKIGVGTLTLAGTNTYGGTTYVNGGTLRLGLPNAIPTDADVVVDGGTYDLGGFTSVITNGSITLLSGSVTNGTFNAALSKTGAGSATLSAAQENAQPLVVSGGTLTLAPTRRSQIAGLYEGRSTVSSFDLTSPNPMTAVKLSATNAYLNFASNAASGGIWVDNSTYIYSGYIWNNAATNENWTFCKSFDDGGYVKIDGNVLISDNLYSNIVLSTVNLTPGPHAIEVRLGQGGGGVGPYSGYPGIGVDRLGRHTKTAAFFQRLQDPGDGSFLTLSAFAGSSLLNTNSTVTVEAGATLNLGGTTQTVAQVSGSGTVSNGTLAVTDTIAPGGTNVIGTLTVASTTLTSGTLLADVDLDGNSDCLAVKGDIDLSALTLQIANPGQLNKQKAYTLLTCTGTRTGTLNATNLPDPHWRLVYSSNGSVKLLYLGGTLMRVR